VNQQIHAPQVRLIDEEGNQIGVVSIREALTAAERAGLDLVEISPNTQPPVCRIMDYGKFRFEKGKKQAAQKKKQRRIQIKEVKFRPVTDIGDYQVKVRKITEFLERGDKVKISLRFRGREMQHRELGMGLLNRIKGDLPSGITVEQEAKIEGRQLAMVVSLGKQESKSTKQS
jgi:translation initiation factor IF-3